MRLGETTKKQLLKIVYRRHKIVASCGFLEISCPILTIDSSKSKSKSRSGSNRNRNRNRSQTAKSKSKSRSYLTSEVNFETDFDFRSQLRSRFRSHFEEPLHQRSYISSLKVIGTSLSVYVTFGQHLLTSLLTKISWNMSTTDTFEDV